MLAGSQIAGLIGSVLQLGGAAVAVYAAIKGQPSDIDAADAENKHVETAVITTTFTRIPGHLRHNEDPTPRILDAISDLHKSMDVMNKASKRNLEWVYDRMDKDRDASLGLVRRLFMRRDVLAGLVLIGVGLVLQIVSYLL
jgi:hypothetical protein